MTPGPVVVVYMENKEDLNIITGISHSHYYRVVGPPKV